MKIRNSTFNRLYRTALITGASSGLGKELAHQLSKHKLSLILVGKDQKKLEQLHIEGQLVCCDLRDPSQRKQLMDLIEQQAPDLVINNAGTGLYGDILSHPLSSFQEMEAINMTAVMELSITAARALRSHKKQGTIVNISSAAAFFPYPTFALYAATKAFVNAFSEAFDDEMRKEGIRILTVCPGQIDTPFRSKAARGFPQEEDRWTMPVERVARLILQQVDRGSPLKIIDWRYQMATMIARLLPRSILFAILRNSLKNRFSDVQTQ